MPEQIVDIESETKELETYWQDRNTQMEEDRAMVNLKKPVTTTAELKWVNNEPKVFYDTAISLVSLYPPRFRLPLTPDFTPDQKTKMNKAERLLIGIFRNLDGRQIRRGQNYWLHDLAYWVLSGWFACFTIVRKQGKGVEFIADLWDPMTVYPEWDADGLVKCVRTFEVDKKTALSMVHNWQAEGLKTTFREPTGDSQIKVINYWREDRTGNGSVVSNAIWIAGQEIKKLQEEKFDHIPIKVGAIGSPEIGSAGWKKRKGEHLIASNRDMYVYGNLILSLLVTIMAETAYPNVATHTRIGEAILGTGLKGFGQEIPLRLEDKIELLKHAAAPAEALQALSIITRQIAKGSFPEAVYGSIPVELSGFAISQLLAAIKYKIAPYLNTMQHIEAAIASDFLTQYKRGKFPKISLTTTDPQALRKGMFYVEDFTVGDVPDAVYVEVTNPLTSALDKTQQILFARQALSPPQLLSRETLWDEVLDVQDSEQEYARILQDEILEMPVVKNIMMIEQLKKRQLMLESQGKFIEAQALKRYIMMVEMGLGMRQGIPQAPGAPGVSPSVSPPELGATGSSPDLVRAALGVSTPGLSRRPQTAEERAESKSRLVGPTGEEINR